MGDLARYMYVTEYLVNYIYDVTVSSRSTE